MEDVKLRLDDKGKGSFYIEENNEQIAFMEIEIEDNRLIIYHTEVLPKGEGKGLAKKIFQTMVEYARNESLTLLPLCTYVQAQLKKNSEEYSDIWKA